MVGCIKFQNRVPFSQDLKDGSKCYMDVIEIQPDAYDDVDEYWLYCNCTLKDGTTAKMRIFDYMYESNFDAPDSEDDYDYMYKGVKYDEAVRLCGYVFTQKSDEGENVNVFEFSDIDAGDTSIKAERVYSTKEFNKNVGEGEFVCANVNRIEFYGFVKSLTSSYLGSAMYQCKTAEDETINVLINNNDYSRYISENSIFDDDILNPKYPDPVELINPVCIYGITANSAKEFTGISDITGTIFVFKETDSKLIEEAKVANQPAVEYSNELKDKQKTFVKIKSIEPKFSESQFGQLGPFAPKKLVCLCELTDGGSVWLYLSELTYQEQFTGNKEVSGKTYVNNITVNGVIRESDLINAELSEKTGAQKVIVFSSVS